MPEFIDTFHKVQNENPKWSIIKTFKTLYVIGEKKHSLTKEIKDCELIDLFTHFLTKTNMKYSSFLAYTAGSIQGKYGNYISRPEFLEFMKSVAMIGKQQFWASKIKTDLT